ncbi:cold-shock protein [Vibrio sp. NTOU-M3]|uniref:cold-shock protein n=1 Tax=Vibrio sp. NTOU-M3 TaxID=3234954 RepID=UPI00349FC4F3
MYVAGTITNWYVEQGYGLIAIESEAKPVFFHIDDMDCGDVKPYLTEAVEFEIEHDMHGCLFALNIHPLS